MRRPHTAARRCGTWWSGARLAFGTEGANVSPQVVYVVLEDPQVLVDLRSHYARLVRGGRWEGGAVVNNRYVIRVVKVPILTEECGQCLRKVWQCLGLLDRWRASGSEGLCCPHRGLLCTWC